MNKKIFLGLLFIIGALADTAFAQTAPAKAYLIDIWYGFYNAIVGDWAKNAPLFIEYVTKMKPVYLLVVIGVPSVFLLHYLIIGPKKFSHEGEQILYYDVFARIIHWLAALFFSLLVFTGLIIIFANVFGGGSFVKFCRYVHLISAFGFGITVVPMFLMWLKDMLPAPYDIKWFLILGGYLSKKKRPIPAGKYNAGQKMWFWLATLGGGFMLFTGFYIYLFNTSLETLRLYTLLHMLLGIAIVALFFTHIYMSMIAIKGALWSMITGYKSADEVSILHSKYYEKLKKKA
ncbi:formate dehydrogenase subunit gamma [Thermodesulfatator autotrophicus]|uniref:Formate dehydrogenase n=1 Tax=Thermodesulfatator autotrophicus TaxID=1795632 RepID=A0A177E9S5_9BACT|nr:formate dehydrogenase subunit gamma [Thermodesulfatator autotrophicus]OAG28170.1 formate dehydrogenase [Thermodesulfatator autotrophicus]